MGWWDDGEWVVDEKLGLGLAEEEFEAFIEREPSARSFARHGRHGLIGHIRCSTCELSTCIYSTTTAVEVSLCRQLVPLPAEWLRCPTCDVVYRLSVPIRRFVARLTDHFTRVHERWREVEEHADRVWRCSRCQRVYPGWLTGDCPFQCGSGGKLEFADRTAIDQYFRPAGRNLLPPPVVTALDPLAKHGTPAQESEARRFFAFLDDGDFPGTGNVVVETLMASSQERRPGWLSRILANETRRIVSHYTGIPASLTFCQPHADEHLRPELRGVWHADTFHQLLIIAYMIGATRTNLPRHYAVLVPYYKHMAQRQREAIDAAVAAAKTRPMPDEIEQIMRNADDPASALRAVRAAYARRRGRPAPASARPTAPPPGEL